jgi:hypothetical protein
MQIACHSGAWHVTGHEPIFKTSNVLRALDHYAKLGFEIFEHDMTYAFAVRDGMIKIHLALTDDGEVIPSSLYLYVDDAHKVAEEWRKVGLEVTGPEDDCGKTEGSHRDPDGNLIRFGSSYDSTDAILEPVGAENSNRPGQPASRYSWIRPKTASRRWS